MYRTLELRKWGSEAPGAGLQGAPPRRCRETGSGRSSSAAAGGSEALRPRRLANLLLPCVNIVREGDVEKALCCDIVAAAGTPAAL